MSGQRQRVRDRYEVVKSADSLGDGPVEPPELVDQVRVHCLTLVR